MNKIYIEAWDHSVRSERTSRKTEKGTSEPNGRSFMLKGGSLGGGTVLELDLPTCPALESERG